MVVPAKTKTAANRRTLAEIVCYLPHQDQRDELASFLVDYELKHGSIDLTRRYTSTLPAETQQWLFNNQPQRWFDGLPAFVQEFLCDKIRSLRHAGQIELTDETTWRSQWIKTGPRENDRIDRYWLSQYFNGPLGSPDKSARFR